MKPLAMWFSVDRFRFPNRRFAIAFLSVLAFFYLYGSFTSRVNIDLDEFPQPIVVSPIVTPSRHDVRKLDEGKFVLQASGTFTAPLSGTTKEMHNLGGHGDKKENINGWASMGTDEFDAIDNEDRLLAGSSHDSLASVDDRMTGGSSITLDTQQQTQTLLVKPQEYQEHNANEDKTLHDGLKSDRLLAERLQSERNLSSLLPHGGNTLPNYLLHGIDQGISPLTYQEGILTFLHHNKAAGSSIKVCFSRMIKRNILKNHSLLVFSAKRISTLKTREITKYNAFAGGYSFWLCELYGGQNCSYFTIMRNPYDRVISSYYYCKVQYWDQLCGPLRVGNFTLEEWAQYQGSYFFYQLLMQQRYCLTNSLIEDMFHYGEVDFIPSGTSKYLDYRETIQCWFKQRVYLSKVLSESDLEYLLHNVLDNLESWFSVVGLTEQFDLSLKMVSVTYQLPFYERCRGRQVNKSPSENKTKESKKARQKAQLQANPEVRRALHFDAMIYEKGLEIFERQKERLQELLGTSWML